MAPPRELRDERELALLSIVRRHGSSVMATARRYSATPEDAEDAYQRGLEILLTKAPTTDENELVPWLRTVIKHEAFALRRQRERHSPVSDDGELVDSGTAPGATHDQAERMERLHHGAEAHRPAQAPGGCARCCSRPRGTPTRRSARSRAGRTRR